MICPQCLNNNIKVLTREESKICICEVCKKIYITSSDLNELIFLNQEAEDAYGLGFDAHIMEHDENPYGLYQRNAPIRKFLHAEWNAGYKKSEDIYEVNSILESSHQEIRRLKSLKTREKWGLLKKTVKFVRIIFTNILFSSKLKKE